MSNLKNASQNKIPATAANSTAVTPNLMKSISTPNLMKSISSLKRANSTTVTPNNSGINLLKTELKYLKQDFKALEEAQAKVSPNSSKFALASDVESIKATLATPILKQVIASNYFATKDEVKAVVDAQAKVLPNSSKFALASNVESIKATLATKEEVKAVVAAQAKITADTSQFVKVSDINNRINSLIAKALEPINTKIQNINNTLTKLQGSRPQKGGMYKKETRKKSKQR